VGRWVDLKLTAGNFSPFDFVPQVMKIYRKMFSWKTI
jgi:hypothetical protein